MRADEAAPLLRSGGAAMIGRGRRPAAGLLRQSRPELREARHLLADGRVLRPLRRFQAIERQAMIIARGVHLPPPSAR
jgi:hypothetical protein